MDRNDAMQVVIVVMNASLSARRAWIEIILNIHKKDRQIVALRKESVDRNWSLDSNAGEFLMSLSARRAWIEMTYVTRLPRAQVVALRKESVDRNLLCRLVAGSLTTVALRKESVDRNDIRHATTPRPSSRSPQGERG